MRVISLNEENIVEGVKDVGESYQIIENEYESEKGEIGQIMQPDGTFITPEPEPVEAQPTLEDKVNYLYYKEKGLII